MSRVKQIVQEKNHIYENMLLEINSLDKKKRSNSFSIQVSIERKLQLAEKTVMYKNEKICATRSTNNDVHVDKFCPLRYYFKLAE